MTFICSRAAGAVANIFNMLRRMWRPPNNKTQQKCFEKWAGAMEQPLGFLRPVSVFTWTPLNGGNTAWHIE